MSFIKELESLINRYSQEKPSDTPDYILAEYLADCLISYNSALRKRTAWYGDNNVSSIKVGDLVVDSDGTTNKGIEMTQEKDYEKALELAKNWTNTSDERTKQSPAKWVTVLAQSYLSLFDELEKVKKDIENYKSGVLNFRCPKCHQVAGPLYPVNLCHELAEAIKVIEWYAEYPKMELRDGNLVTIESDSGNRAREFLSKLEKNK